MADIAQLVQSNAWQFVAVVDQFSKHRPEDGKVSAVRPGRRNLLKRMTGDRDDWGCDTRLVKYGARFAGAKVAGRAQMNAVGAAGDSDVDARIDQQLGAR